MQMYRIAQEQFAADLSGKGVWLNGGRWNSEGRFALYASSSRALALLEILAHAPAKMLDIRPYLLLTLEAANTVSTEHISLNMLPVNWNATNTSHTTTQMGDHFLQKRQALLLTIPSVIMPEEFNYLINPLHPEMEKLSITHSRRIEFDKRLF